MQIGFYTIILLLFSFSCQRTGEPVQEHTIGQVMDEVIARLYKNVPAAQYDRIDDSFMMGFLSDEERKVLATRYLYFTVDVPVTVSLMRHKDQPVIPFWLTEAKFGKTDQVVKNEEGYVYEVWEKKYDAGKVELGINGFDKHRPVYFISVAPQDPTNALEITNVYPSEFALDTMRVGAFTYHDWSGLLDGTVYGDDQVVFSARSVKIAMIYFLAKGSKPQASSCVSRGLGVITSNLARSGVPGLLTLRNYGNFIL